MPRAAAATSSLGRPPVRQELVLEALRQEIVSDASAPGQRLPTRVNLQSRFKSSAITVQRALDRLRRDGLVESRGRAGTFIAEHPPYMFRYALVVPYDPLGTPTSFFTEALLHAAGDERLRPRRIALFRNVDGHADSEDYRLLLADVQARRLAGLIFVFAPHLLAGTTLMQRADVPRVAFMSGPIPDVPAIDFDPESYAEAITQRLRHRGCRRPAILAGLSSNTSTVRALLKRWPVPPHLRLFFSPFYEEGVRGVCNLLTRLPASEFPDSIVILDDHLVPGATLGLLDGGIRPGQLEIIAHANFPLPSAAYLPAWRVGCDARQLLRVAIQHIDQQRLGGKASGHVIVPSVSQDQFNAGEEKCEPR